MEKSAGETPVLPIETGARCFLCLIKLELESGESRMSSIHEIVHYLKIDLGKLPDEEGRLEVTLCEECASVNKDFTELHQQLNENKTEELELEMGYCLKLIHGKLSNAEKTGLGEELDENSFRCAIGLRKEMIKYCSLTLSNVLANFEEVDENEKLEDSVTGPSDTKIKSEPAEMDVTSEDCTDGRIDRAGEDSTSDNDWKPSTMEEIDSSTDWSDPEDEETFATKADDAEGEVTMDVNSNSANNSLLLVHPPKPPNNVGQPSSILNPETDNYKCSNCEK